VRAAPSIRRQPSTRSARLWTVSLDPNLDEYLRRRRHASVVPKDAYCTDRVALDVLSQAFGVLAAPSINWRTLTPSARLWTVSLDPNPDEFLRKRRQASVVPKVAYCTERVALKVVSQALGGAGGAVIELADLDPFRSLLDRVARSQF
jgi:hypothetical protein